MAWHKRQDKIIEYGKYNALYPNVSMVVSAYNEERYIKEKIENFLSLDYPEGKVELLIGSDGSTDRTASLISSFSNERVKFFEFPIRRGKISVLNDIVKEVKGEIIVFSDADTMYDKDAVKNLVRYFGDEEVGGVCGRLALSQTSHSLSEEGLYWKYENFIKEKESEIGTIVGINGQIFAVRKGLFEPLPENIITEDQVLGMKIVGRGYRILFDREAIAREDIGTLKEEFERRVRISAGNFQSISFSAKVLDPRMGYASFALWSHKILRWFAPFFLISIFIANLFLLDSPIFKLIFFSQALFYSIPILYYLLTKMGLNVTILKVISYFVIMNLAILIGFFRFLAKVQKVTWQKRS